MIEVQLDIHASLAIHDREAGGLPQELRGNGQYRAVALTDNWPGRHWTRHYIAKWPPYVEAPHRSRPWTRRDVSGVVLLVEPAPRPCPFCSTEVRGLELPVEGIPVLGFNAAWHPRLICCPHCEAATEGTQLSSLVVALDAPTPEAAPYLYRQPDGPHAWQPSAS
jgi:hypothetical protein